MDKTASQIEKVLEGLGGTSWKVEPLMKAGESVEVPITKYLTYTVKHDGWTLNVKASRGDLIVRHNPDGSVTIGCNGPVEDDEV